MTNEEKKNMEAVELSDEQMGEAAGGSEGDQTWIGSVGAFIGGEYDAAMREMKEDQEKMRSQRDALKSINESLSELMEKSTATQDEVQKMMNQTRKEFPGQ